MKKSHLKALEAVFANEVERALSGADAEYPFQSKAKVYRDLEAAGLVWQSSVSDGVMTVTGWELTPAGHLAYCMECRDEPEAA